ncbi:MAG: YccT family protein, partial [Plesiomonas shigelloides]
QTLFTSAPIVASFDASADQKLTIELPKLNTDSDGKRFNQSLDFRLVDQNGKTVPYKSDVLAVDGLMSSRNIQEALATYNHSSSAAAVANLAPAMTATLAVPVAAGTATAANTAVTQQTVTLQGENVPEQMLQYWFQQADAKTQQRFMNWAKDHARP